MRGAAVLTRTSSLWLIGLALYVALKSGAAMRWVSQTVDEADYALHDTYYVVANTHDLISTGSMFVIFAAFYFWCERAWGRRYDDRLGKAHVVLAMTGMALIVAPQVALFLQGQPHAQVDYAAYFRASNMVSSAGFVVFALSLIPFILVCLRGYFTPPEPA